jgi:hypothetical protein
MDKEAVVDLINKAAIAQGEIQRAMIWLSRLHKDLHELMKQLVCERDKQ